MRKIMVLAALAMLTGGLAACVSYGDGPTLAGMSGEHLTLRYNPAEVSAAEVASAAADCCPDKAPVPHLVSRSRYQADAVYAEFECGPAAEKAAPNKTRAEKAAPNKTRVKKTATK